ncbi:MAG: GTP-binding protein [Proteobacteria bacterium]|nr:GTP-binding protein [Pseudomonadota bacterium]
MTGPVASPGGIPVATIGGYLGAGKTTLLNALLAADHGLRIGVLVNDFGAISIDEALIEARDGDMVALANGCACCTVAGDLASALDRLAAGGRRYNLLLVEASGVADPARIAALARSPGLRPGATIVVADAETIRERAGDKFVGRLVRRQLGGADAVVLSKVDLIDVARMDAARAFARDLAPDARLFEAAQGRLNFADLLQVSRHEASGLICAAVDADLAATDLFETHRWMARLPPDLDRLEALVTALPAAVVRVKGVIGLPDGGVVSLQRAGARVEVKPLRKAAPVAGAEIVVIGRAGEIDWADLDCLLDASVIPYGTIQ